MEPTIGLLELNSIAQGIKCADIMVKSGDVKLIEAHSICPGKFIVLVSGDVGAVKNSLLEGVDAAGNFYVDDLVIPNIHPQLIPAIQGVIDIDVNKIDAVGVNEYFSAASCIVAVDISCKDSKVNLIEVRLGMALGGKSYYVLTGEIGDVRSAINAGVDFGKERGELVNSIVIPAPNSQLWRKLF